MPDESFLDARSTALVAIDLQSSNVSRELAPHPASQVVARTVELADDLRARGGLVVWVRVDVTAILALPADKPLSRGADAPAPPAGASELVAALGRQPHDIVVVKRNWGAFYGTDLDLQLRRRQIESVVMSGIATNFGVESTARGAFDRGYRLLFAEDAMSSISAAMHASAVETTFAHMGKVRSVAAIRAQLR